jgi:hypothetical protein
LQGAISSAPLPDEKAGREFSSSGTSIDEEKGILVSVSELDRTLYHNDTNVVDWNGPNDPEMAMNWISKKKWTMTFLLSTLTLLTYAQNMILPYLAFN